MREKLRAALSDAIKTSKKRRVSTLRLINAAIKDRDISARTTDSGPISDDTILEILAKMVKQREESSKLYEEAGRIELADQEKEEMAIIQEFMPSQLDEGQIEAACTEAIKATGATSLRDMGKCMAYLKERFSGQMDFGKANQIIKSLLQ